MPRTHALSEMHACLVPSRRVQTAKIFSPKYPKPTIRENFPVYGIYSYRSLCSITLHVCFCHMEVFCMRYGITCNFLNWQHLEYRGYSISMISKCLVMFRRKDRFSDGLVTTRGSHVKTSPLNLFPPAFSFHTLYSTSACGQ